jgi:hypothetical protein
MQTTGPSARSAGYATALTRAFDDLAVRSREGLSALGAVAAESGRLDLPVLGEVFRIDPAARTVTRAVDGPEIRIEWQILALHYLLARPGPSESVRWVGFRDLPEGRVYGDVFRKRVLDRIVATAGKDREGFVRASRALGGERASVGDEGFAFRVFPRLRVAVGWFAGDDEFPPDAAFLYPDDVLSLLPIEDIIVLAERVAARLHDAAGGSRG